MLKLLLLPLEIAKQVLQKRDWNFKGEQCFEIADWQFEIESIIQIRIKLVAVSYFCILNSITL